MAKKKLTVKTRLDKVASPEQAREKLNLVKKPKTQLKSYIWREWELGLIEEMLAELSKVSSHYKVNASQLIRGALYIASKKKPEQLLDKVLEAERLSMLTKSD